MRIYQFQKMVFPNYYIQVHLDIVLNKKKKKKKYLLKN